MNVNGTPTSDHLAKEVLEQHKQIHFYLDRIAETLEQLDPNLADVEPMRRLAAEIEGLKERLVEHHDLEERGGLFRSILEALPEARVEISRLVRGHAQMIEVLEMAAIHARQGEPASAHALRIDLTGFVRMFRDHEHEEERLIRDAMAREGGA